MRNEEELLIEFGFSLYEAKILSALHNLKSATAKEIGIKSEVPKNKVYEILELLKNKGIVKLLIGKPKKFGLINFKQILKNKIKDNKENLNSLDKKIDNFFDNPIKDKSYEQTFWVMHGEDAMVNKIVEVLEDIKEESIGFIDVWVVKPENLIAAKKAIKRGVKIYFLGTIDERTKPMAKKYAKIGVKIKNYNVKGAGYSIFDEKFLQIRISEKEIINLWVENENLAKILRQHFFEMWKKAKSVKFN